MEEIDETRLILENWHHFLTTCSRDALNVTANRTKVLLINTEKCSNRKSPLEQLKSYRDGRNLTHKQLRGPTTWKDMLRNALNDTVNWQKKKWSDFTKFQIFAWMITNSRKRNLNQWENCQKCAHKLFWNACTWHASVDLTFCDQSTNWLVQSQMRNAWNDTANWRIERLSMTINSKRKKWERWEDCQKLAVKLSGNACIWQHASVDLKVDEQTDTSSHKLDKIMWQTIGSFVTDNTSMWWNTARHCRLGRFQDSLRLCWDLEDSTSTSEKSMYLRMSNVCSHQFDVPEANISIPQLYRVWNLWRL